MLQLLLLNALISPRKYVDYEELEASREELAAIEALDGDKKKGLFHRDENAKRELVLPPMKNAFIEFAAAIEKGTADIFAKEALRATKIGLAARESADNNGTKVDI